MITGLSVSPDALRAAATHWRLLAKEVEFPPASSEKGTWPTQGAVSSVGKGATKASAAVADGLSDAADKAQVHAGTYEKVDGDGGAQLAGRGTPKVPAKKPRRPTVAERDDQVNRSILQNTQTKLVNEINDLTASGKNDKLLGADTTRLAELGAINTALNHAPDTYLTQLHISTDIHQRVGAAIAVGNPDTAANVTVVVPGLGSSASVLPINVSEANRLQLEEIRQLHNAGKPESASVIAWVNYQPPANPLDTRSLRDALAALSDQPAKAGAIDLSNYLQQISLHNPGGHVSLLGFSYGSLAASLALQDLHAAGVQPVADAVFYGSAGMDLYSVNQLGLPPGHAYVMETPHDPVANLLAPLAPLHDWGINPYTPGLMPELSAHAGTDPGGMWHDGADLHGHYTSVFTDSQGQPELRMPGYNLAAVGAGLPENLVREPLLPFLTPPMAPRR